MPTAPIIRAERPDDHGVLSDLITAAFAGQPYAGGDEADLLVALRGEDALSLSLVAELDGEVVGQAAWSPARAADGSLAWYALGPVAVLPSHQRTGIGSQLVRAGLEIITGLGADGCIVVGDPAYYTRFGFSVCPENVPTGQPAEYFMIHVLEGDSPVGPIAFHDVFGSGH